MTYRQDSDFYSPYGSIQKTQELPENLPDYIQKYGEDHQDDEIIRGKTKAIAWFVSNCEANSNRLEYVKGKKMHLHESCLFFIEKMAKYILWHARYSFE